MKALVRHSWPRNVRELQNVIECSVILSTSAVLSGSLQELPHPAQDGSKWSKRSMPVTLLDGPDFAHPSDAPRNQGCDRWSERRRRQAGLGPDDVDLQNEAAGYHSMVTETWSGYLKGLL